MTTKHRTRPTTPEDWAENREPRKGKPSHNAKRRTETAREWKQYARSNY